MSEHQIYVDVVIIPKQVELIERQAYLFVDGQLQDLGGIDCIRSHIPDDAYALRDHLAYDGGMFDKSGGKGIHVIRYDTDQETP